MKSARPPVVTACARSSRGRPPSARSDPAGRRRRRPHRTGSDRAAARRADSAAQQSAAAGRDALKSTASRRLPRQGPDGHPQSARDVVSALVEIGRSEPKGATPTIGKPAASIESSGPRLDEGLDRGASVQSPRRSLRSSSPRRRADRGYRHGPVALLIPPRTHARLDRAPGR
jgi:hypothetical protein